MTVFAQVQRKGMSDLISEFQGMGWVILGSLVFVGLGVWIVSNIRTRLAEDEDSNLEDHRLLTQVGDLHKQGDLTEEEYRSIKGRLGKRLNDFPESHIEATPTHNSVNADSAESDR